MRLGVSDMTMLVFSGYCSCDLQAQSFGPPKSYQSSVLFLVRILDDAKTGAAAGDISAEAMDGRRCEGRDHRLRNDSETPNAEAQPALNGRVSHKLRPFFGLKFLYKKNHGFANYLWLADR